MLLRYQRSMLLAVLVVIACGGVPRAHAAEGDAAPLEIGVSVQGRAITATRFGSGARAVVIVGATHGDERNTAALTSDLTAAFGAHLDRLPPDVSLYLIQALNPDGQAAGTRYNAHSIDLNRNWATSDWQADTVDSDGRHAGGGGSAPFSEPESAALAAWLTTLRAAPGSAVTVLFYHAAYPPRGLVLGGSVGRETTGAFAEVIGYGTPSDGRWSAYPVTGASVTWCREQAIGCFEIELPNQRTLSTAAVQQHAAAILGVLLRGQVAPGQRCFWETGFCIAGRIRAFWEAHDGLRTFGLPLGYAQPQTIDGQERTVQWFERARIELHPEHAAPNDVQLGALGSEALAQQGRAWWSEPRGAQAPGCQHFAATAHSVCGDFLAAWQTRGLALLGAPLSEAQTEQLPDGRSATVQWFERARLELDPAAPLATRVRFGRLGSERVQPDG